MSVHPFPPKRIQCQRCQELRGASDRVGVRVSEVWAHADGTQEVRDNDIICLRCYVRDGVIEVLWRSSR